MPRKDTSRTSVAKCGPMYEDSFAVGKKRYVANRNKITYNSIPYSTIAPYSVFNPRRSSITFLVSKEYRLYSFKYVNHHISLPFIR